MTNLKSTRRALFTSVIAFVLCFSMLLGTTYAWFTDSVTSTGNIIKTGTLEITLEYSDEALTDAESENWKDASQNAIFNYDNWEPGYTQVKYVKIENEGSLDLKFMLNIVPEKELEAGEVNLADVIEVYMVEGAFAVNRADLTTTSTAYVGTLTSLMNDPDGAAYGVLYADDSENTGNVHKIYTIALKMSESAGNEYQDKSVGGAFAVQLLATQLANEEDSFGKDYDDKAEYPENVVATADDLVEALENGEDAFFVENIKIDPANMSNAYGTTGLNVKNGQTIDGNGYTLDVAGAGGTWDSGISTTGGLIKNITVTGSFRGIFINHNSTHSERVILENVTIDGTTYTISCDQGMNQGLTATNSTFNGWTSYAATIGDVEFNNCSFGEGNGYAFCRPYAPTTFTNCEFEAGYEMDPRAAVVLENCYLDGVLITADNLDTLVTSNIANATVITDGKLGVTSAEALVTAIEAGYTEIALAAGEYKMPSSNTTGTVKITGTKDTVIDVTAGAYMDSATVTFEGVTIKTGTGYANGNGSDYAAFYTPNVTYVDCTFVGPMRVGRDGAKFINCTFTELGNDYVWTYGNDVTFEKCTFNTDGKAILIYSDGGNEISEVSVKNCTFNSTTGAKAGAIANQNCAAIEIHNYGNGVNLVTEGNTYDSNFSGEWRIKTYETGKTQVFVNGTEYTTIVLDGKTMTIDGNKNVTVNE